MEINFEEEHLYYQYDSAKAKKLSLEEYEQELKENDLYDETGEEEFEIYKYFISEMLE